MRGGKLALAVVIASLVFPFVGCAAPVPVHWRAPAWWLRQAVCVHEREGAWNAIGYVRGVPTYGGGLQFLLSTWHSVGGVAGSLGDIAAASPREQLYRAWLLYLRSGHSWSQWGTARACGLQ